MSEIEREAEHRRAVVADRFVVVLRADASAQAADAALHALRSGELAALEANPAVESVLTREVPQAAEAPQAPPPSAPRAAAPPRKLITGPPRASAADPAPPAARGEAPRPAAVDEHTLTVESTGEQAGIGEQAGALEHTVTVEHTAGLADAAEHTETFGPTGEHDTEAQQPGAALSDAELLHADTLTAAGSAPVVATRGRAEASGAPRVLSVLCGQGHVQRPGLTACDDCGEPIEPGTEALRIRPEFVCAQVPGQDPVPLGRGAVFGRRPRSNRMQGVRVPHLVTLSSPDEDISRSHLEIRLEDWSVLAVDLGSTNGTMLLREGRAPLRLRAGVATNVDVGDRLNVGDGVVITLEAM